MPAIPPSYADTPPFVVGMSKLSVAEVVVGKECYLHTWVVDLHAYFLAYALAGMCSLVADKFVADVLDNVMVGVKIGFRKQVDQFASARVVVRFGNENKFDFVAASGLFQTVEIGIDLKHEIGFR